MTLLKELLDNSFRIFDAATLKGFYFLPFVAAVLYLLCLEDDRHKRFIRRIPVPCILGFLFLLSPLFGRMCKGHGTDQMTRFYWTLPFAVIVIYCLVEILYRLRRPLAKGVFLCVVAFGLMACSRQDNMTSPKDGQGWPYVKAENLYKLPNAVYETCNIIQQQQNGAECRAVFPHDLAMCVRQYDASIMMPYGSYRNEWWNDVFSLINGDTIDLDVVAAYAEDYNWDYIVLDQGKIAGGTLTDYGQLATVQDGDITYVIYQHQ